MRARWFILPAMLLCMACSKQTIDAPAAQREQLQSEYGPFVDPNGRAEGSGIDPHGIKGDNDAGSSMDPNGKDSGPIMDPNGKPGNAGKGMGLDPNG